MTLITFPWTVDSVLTDATSVKFSDPTGTYGLRRTDTSEILLADGVDLTHVGVGLYEYNLIDPAPGLFYDYWIEVLYLASTYRVHYPAQSSGIPLITLAGISFTSRLEIERLYSQAGVNLRLDDGSTTAAQDDMMNDIINAATETVSSYTLRFYRNEDISSSAWVRRRATVIAAYYLSMRRANGTQFESYYRTIIEELEKFNKGVPPIIPGAPIRTAPVPTTSRQIVDDRFRYKKLKTVADQSTFTYPGRDEYRILFQGVPF